MREQMHKLSQGYKTRSKEDTQRLYEYIEGLALTAQDVDNPDSKKAMEDLLTMFKPKICRIVKNYFNVVKDYCELDDFLQESYCIFIALVYAFDPTRSYFLHYINEYLHNKIRNWAEKVVKQNHFITLIGFDDVEEYGQTHRDGIFSQLLKDMYDDEYLDFIQRLSTKRTKTKTLQVICRDYFLGTKKCQVIADDLGITYHAVYDYITKIKRELNHYLKTDDKFDFYYTNEGVLRYKKGAGHA